MTEHAGKKKGLRVLALIALLAMSARCFGWKARGGKRGSVTRDDVSAGRRGGRTNAIAEAERLFYWYDAMEPQHHYDKPGKAPDGMDLVPKYADEASQLRPPDYARRAQNSLLV